MSDKFGIRMFFLKNTVQRWHRLADRLRQQSAPAADDAPSAAVQDDIRAVQQQLMACARDNQWPRAGA